ncbi:MAG: Transposase, IS4 family [Anaerolinea thermophila]|uniref:Transposase, IS4 family n=1 Tax=Anaerolinea thermophila TaxID=167964 RepID=A0A101FXY1_9CHLR|nr:MAG: Transposase, IS4 family [Anaerolinea thermophila]
MPTNQLYHTWIQRILELRPGQRITQVRNFVWLIIGIYQSRSVSLSRIASKIPGSAQLLSFTRRLSRLLENPAIDVRSWYEPIAKSWLAQQAAHLQQVTLIVDGTKVGFAHQLLMISLAYRRRAIPIAWTWVKQVRGHSTAATQLALLAYVRTLLPQGIAVLLVGDTEFGSIKVLQQLDKWHWNYVLRQKTSTHVCLARQCEWKDFGSWVTKAGRSLWLGKGWLTESEIYPVNLLAHWRIGEKEPWCLATNLPDQRMALRAYARRMWIEEMFGDMKKHGFDLENTMLRHADRLSRLTLAVALLYVWMISTGTRTIQDGLRYLVDRKDRRDLSVFQIGLRFIDRQLLNSLPFQLSLCSYQ